MNAAMSNKKKPPTPSVQRSIEVAFAHPEKTPHQRLEAALKLSDAARMSRRVEGVLIEAASCLPISELEADGLKMRAAALIEVLHCLEQAEALEYEKQAREQAATQLATTKALLERAAQ
jgi:hypothetical protein